MTQQNKPSTTDLNDHLITPNGPPPINLQQINLKNNTGMDTDDNNNSSDNKTAHTSSKKHIQQKTQTADDQQTQTRSQYPLTQHHPSPIADTQHTSHHVNNSSSMEEKQDNEVKKNYNYAFVSFGGLFRILSR